MPSRLIFEEAIMKKTNSNGKWIVTAIAFVLAFVLIVGLCLQVFGTGKARPSEWFKKNDQTEELPEEGGENAFVQDKQEYGIQLMSARAASGSTYKASYVLTATVLPEDADNKNVAWSIAWENPASAWATGKNVTDYMRATDMVSTDDLEFDTFGTSYRAAFASKKAYGEPIVVTVKSQDDETKSASVTFGYVARVNETSAKVTLKRNGQAVDTVVFGDNQTYTIDFTYTMTDGTVMPNVSLSYYQAMVSRDGADLYDDCGKSQVEVENGTFVSSANFYQTFFTRTVSVSEFKTYCAAWGTTGTPFTVGATVTVSCAETTNIYKTTLIKTAACKVNASGLKVGVNSVTTDQSGELYF